MAPGFFAKLARSRHSSDASPGSTEHARTRAITLAGSSSSGLSGSSIADSAGSKEHIPKVEVTPVLTNGIVTMPGSTKSARSSVTSPEVTVVPPSPQSLRRSIEPETDMGAEKNGGSGGDGRRVEEQKKKDGKRRPEPLTSWSDESAKMNKAPFTVDSPSEWQDSPDAVTPGNSASTALPTSDTPKGFSPSMTATNGSRHLSPNGQSTSPELPSYDDPTPTPLHGRAATYAGSVDPSLLSPSTKRDGDAVSINSTASRKRGLFKKSSFTNAPPVPSSPRRKPTGLASAIASSGLAMANPAVSMAPQPMPDGWRPRSVGKEGPPSPPTSKSNTRANRSRALYATVDGDTPLTMSPRSRSNSLTIPNNNDGDLSSGSGDDGEMDEDDAQLLADIGADDIPVTGFAVASNKRNADFHELFSAVPEGDYLIEDYGCALQRDILIQGRLYISEHHICFHANIFGWVTDVIIPIYEILSLEKKMTAFVIPNAILITTRTAKYTFASFLARDTVYDVIDNIRKLERSDGAGSERDVVISGPMTPAAAAAAATAAGGAAALATNKVTQCECGTQGKHYPEVAMDTVLPGTPEKIYNLMFASGFIKDFMRVDLKLEDIQISDWTPSSEDPKCLSRNMSYIKPLAGPIGPKSTKCEIRDETIHCDFDDYVVTITTTRTPNVPSGNAFAVKTRTCMMWASAVSTRVIITTQVEWSGRSFIRNIIDRSCIDGQKSHHIDLDKAMRAYINEHKTEFLPAGVDPGLVDAAPTPTASPGEPGAKAEGKQKSPAELAEERERERNARGMQWAYDTFAGAADVGRRSATGAIELIREAWDQSTGTMVLWVVIVLLVLSNLWTLSRMGRREEVGRRKEMKKVAEQERWVQGMVGALWDEMAAAAAAREREREHAGIGTAGAVGSRPLKADGTVDVLAEVAALGSALDAVEERVRSLRQSLNLDALD